MINKGSRSNALDSTAVATVSRGRGYTLKDVASSFVAVQFNIRRRLANFIDCFACVAGAPLKTDSRCVRAYISFVLRGGLPLFAGVVRPWARVLKPSGGCCCCCCMGGGSCFSQQMPTELPTWMLRHRGAHLATAQGGDRLRLQDLRLPRQYGS